jgi:hypothetical protein
MGTIMTFNQEELKHRWREYRATLSNNIKIAKLTPTSRRLLVSRIGFLVRQIARIECEAEWRGIELGRN